MWHPHLLISLCSFGYAVAIPSPPLITKQPNSNEILFHVATTYYEAEKPFSIECDADGEPAPTFQWIKNGKPFDWLAYDHRMVQQPGDGTLVITNPRDEDFGQYQCFATNPFGTATSNSVFVRNVNSIRHDVLPAGQLPHFTIEPELVIAGEEEDATFQCEAHGDPQPSINWIFNGKPIADAPVNNRRVVTSSSITIKKLTLSDTGNYGCNATNNLGYVYRDVYLNVLALPPEIQLYPGIETDVEGKNVKLVCEVFGVPKLQVKWTKDGNNLSGDRFKVTTGGSLEITNVTFTDAGEYQCSATNKFGNKTAVGTLIVKRATLIIDNPQDYEVIRGLSAIFRCSAVADTDLELNIDWLKNGLIIDYTNTRFVKLNDNSLQIINTIDSDSGDYTCVASTVLDSVEAKATLFVIDIPNPPKLVKVDCFEHGATLFWEPQGDGGTPILYYEIKYNSSLAPDVWIYLTERIPSAESIYHVEMEFLPWTSYSFKVLATNKIGMSHSSNQSEFCTSSKEDVPYRNPGYVKGEGTEPNNMVISWAPMPKFEHNAPNFHYRISWKEDLIDAVWSHEEILNWEQSTLVIHDTPIFQQYRIKVAAVNRNGHANVEPHEVIGHSGEDKPTEAPSNFTVIRVIDSKRVLFGWTKVSSDSLNGHFKGYIIEIWTEKNPDRIRKTKIKPNLESFEVKNCFPWSKQFARIMVYNGRHNGPTSNIVSFKTLEGLPGIVTRLRSVPLGSTGFWLKWNPPSEPNGQITGYKFYYKDIVGIYHEPTLQRELKILDPHIKSVKLLGLKPNTNYQFRIQAMTKAGEGDYYDIQFDTLEDSIFVPEIPNFTYEKIEGNYDHGAVKVNWQPYGKHAGSHFFAKYRKNDTLNWTKTDFVLNKDYLVIPNLNSTYEIRVVAVHGEHTTESESQFV